MERESVGGRYLASQQHQSQNYPAGVSNASDRTGGQESGPPRQVAPAWGSYQPVAAAQQYQPRSYAPSSSLTEPQTASYIQPQQPGAHLVERNEPEMQQHQHHGAAGQAQPRYMVGHTNRSYQAQMSSQGRDPAQYEHTAMMGWQAQQPMSVDPGFRVSSAPQVHPASQPHFSHPQHRAPVAYARPHAHGPSPSAMVTGELKPGANSVKVHTSRRWVVFVWLLIAGCATLAITSFGSSGAVPPVPVGVEQNPGASRSPHGNGKEQQSVGAADEPMIARQVHHMTDMQFKVHLESHRPRKKGSGAYAEAVPKPVTKRSFFSKRLSTTFCPVPKVASSNWKYLFRKFTGVATYQNLAEAHDRKTSGLKYLWDMEPDQMEEWMQDKANFKFMFVRNPYSRVLSCYLNKFVGKTEQSEEYRGYMTQLFKAKTDAEFAAKPTFAQFVEAIRKQGLGEMNEHWAVQTYLCSNNIVAYDFIGRYEQLDADSATVLRRLGFGESEQFPSQKQINFLGSGADGRIKEFYTKHIADMVYEIYKADFEAFDYSRELKELST